MLSSIAAASVKSGIPVVATWLTNAEELPVVPVVPVVVTSSLPVVLPPVVLPPVVLPPVVVPLVPLVPLESLLAVAECIAARTTKIRITVVKDCMSSGSVVGLGDGLAIGTAKRKRD